MLDGQIVAAMIEEIKNQLVIYGIDDNDLRVSRSSQPTAQGSGAASGARKYQVFIQPVTNTEVGWGRQYSELNEAETALKVRHTKQKTYQISALSDFDPSRPDDIPAHDIAEIINDMIQQPDAIRALKAKGVYMQSCTPVRPAFEINQADNYESMPSFDIVITYNSEYTKPVPAVVDVTGEVDRV